MNKNANAEATPDQLLTLLDLQIAAQRNQRKTRAHWRPLLLVGGLLLICAVAIAAFVILHGMLANVTQGEGRAPVTPPMETGSSGNF